MARRSVGGGIADFESIQPVGVSEGAGALGMAGQAAALEQSREAQNRQIVSANRAANVQLGAALGGAAGYAAGAQIGWVGGPWGAAIGSVIGGLAGSLF